MEIQDYYKILNISSLATTEEIKKEFRIGYLLALFFVFWGYSAILTIKENY